MKTKKEAADECIQLFNNDGYIPNYTEDDYNAGFLEGVRRGFNEGVEYAQRWIRVEQELPEFSEENKNRQFLVKGHIELNGKSGKEFFSVLRLDYAAHDYGIDCFDIDRHNLVVTHWRPIELK
jgi:hypothetical protein